ncbi:MAG: hypothetical protein Q9207_004051 [Kuettlingeria erythrocarpa]
MLGSFVPCFNIPTPSVGHRFQSGRSARDPQLKVSLTLVCLNIALDSSEGVDALDSTLLHIQSSICPLSKLRELDLSIKSIDAPTSTTDVAARRLENVFDLLPSLEILTLRNYSFQPRSICLPSIVNLARIKHLELYRCSNIGFLFNNLLSMLRNVQLQTLRIVDRRPELASGYMGKAKMECFLEVYRGLETLEICGLGEYSPYLEAIISQGASLHTLLLDPSYALDSLGDFHDASSKVAQQTERIISHCPGIQKLHFTSRRADIV